MDQTSFYQLKQGAAPQLKKIKAPPFTKQTNKLSMTTVTLLYVLS